MERSCAGIAKSISQLNRASLRITNKVIEKSKVYSVIPAMKPKPVYEVFKGILREATNFERDEFEKLFDMVEMSIKTAGSHTKRDALLATLHWLKTGESLSEMVEFVGGCKTCVSEMLWSTVKALASATENQVAWPDEQTRRRLVGTLSPRYF